MLVCLIMSAYFSATETAFLSMNKTKMKTLAEKGDRGAALACKLEERYDKLISTILIGNNIVNIALASIGTVMFTRELGDIGATVSTVVVTIVVLIFGEISPKSIAKDCAEKFACFSAPIIQAIIWFFTPLCADERALRNARRGGQSCEAGAYSAYCAFVYCRTRAGRRADAI